MKQAQSGSPLASRTSRKVSVLRARNASQIVALIALVLAAMYPLALPPGGTRVLAVYAIYFMWISLAEAWNLVGGFAGLLNLGLSAFFALGGVVGAIVLSNGLPFVVSLLLAGVTGAGLGLALVPTFRLRSFYFAIATLVVPLIIKPIVEFLSNRADFVVPQNQILTATELYYAGLAIIGTTIFGIHVMMESRVGFALRALGDDETASSSLGINVLKYKSIALVVSGFVASMVGAYYLQIIGTVNTTLFEDLSFSLFPIFMVIIGGVGTFEGPVVGAIIFSVINYYLTSQFPGRTIDTFILSLMIIGVAVLLPKGLVPSFRRLRKRTSTSTRC